MGLADRDYMREPTPSRPATPAGPGGWQHFRFLCWLAWRRVRDRLRGRRNDQGPRGR